MSNNLQVQQDFLAALRKQKNPDNTIGVEVHHGVVKLAGRIDEYAMQKAELAARRVNGVSSVIMDSVTRASISDIGVPKQRHVRRYPG